MKIKRQGKNYPIQDAYLYQRNYSQANCNISDPP